MTAAVLPSVALTVSKPAEDAEAVLRRLDWHVVRRLDGMLQGDYRSLFTGQGYDLAEIREYQPEDDVRHGLERHSTHGSLREAIYRRPRDHRLALAGRLPSVDFGSQRP
jgi:hypothetical protein